jgi:hypothetical protein
VLLVPVSHLSLRPFDITCKDIVYVEGRHGETVFRTFVLQADRLNDLIKGEEARGNTNFVVAITLTHRLFNKEISLLPLGGLEGLFHLIAYKCSA